MSERTLEVVDQKTLTADLKAMQVRPAYVESWHGTTILGSFVPTLKSWSAGEPEAIGSDIHDVVDGNAGTLRIYSLSKKGGFTRREEITTGGKTRTRLMEHPESTLRDAQVMSVKDVELRRGTFHLLRLMELGNSNPDDEFVISLPDLAYRIQKDFAELTVS